MSDTSVRRRRPFGFLLGFTVALTGCPQPYPACRSDRECKPASSEVCVNGTCQNCKTDDDCAGMLSDELGPLVCYEFRCQSSGTHPVEFGGPCIDRSQCAQQLACRQGICSNCVDNVDCDGFPCDAGSGRCAPPGLCKSDQQCPMDEVCEAGICVFGELADGDPKCDSNTVYFDFDSASLTPDGEAVVSQWVECTKGDPRTLYLEAHADNRGSEEYNILLSERRGASVRRYMLDLGLDGNNLVVIAKGSLEATGTDDDSRANDRRVQFIFP